MMVHLEGLEGIDREKLMELLSVKFGSSDTYAINEKMIKSNMLLMTGEFVVRKHPAFNSDTKKVIKILAEHGIMVMPRARINLQRLADLIGADNMALLVKKKDKNASSNQGNNTSN